MSRAGTRSCVACSVRKGPIFLMFCSANLNDRAVFCNMIFKCQQIIKDHTNKIPDWTRWEYRWWAQLDGKLVLYWWGGWEDEKLCLCQVELEVMLFNPIWDVRQSTLDHLVETRDRAVCHQHNNGRKNHVLVWWTQWCCVYGEEERSKNRSLGNPMDQLMWFGYLSSLRHPEGPTCEVRLKPVESSSGDAQRWEGGRKDSMINSV